MARTTTSSTFRSGLGHALGVMRGYDTYGPGTKATLYIGRTAGLTLSGYREGQKIPAVQVEDAIGVRRVRQVGLAAYGSTAVAAKGVYQGGAEPTLKVELVWVKVPREKSRAAFVRNVRQLAQDVALDLAQREIIIEWTAPGKIGGRVDTATPTPAPPRTREAPYCAWVRAHSGAGTRPTDPCYVAPKKKRKAR